MFPRRTQLGRCPVLHCSVQSAGSSTLQRCQRLITEMSKSGWVDDATCCEVVTTGAPVVACVAPVAGAAGAVEAQPTPTGHESTRPRRRRREKDGRTERFGFVIVTSFPCHSEAVRSGLREIVSGSGTAASAGGAAPFRP